MNVESDTLRLSRIGRWYVGGPDPTPREVGHPGYRGAPCGSSVTYVWVPATYWCTRPCGHGGLHIAGDGQVIRAVWS